jgi:CheY-like chemotaxis protein
VSGENGKEERRPARDNEQPATSNQQRVTFKIMDTGIGIPKERIEPIFIPFTKGSLKGEWTEGTGLGLSISRRLIELMGGKLLVESEVGKGSTFIVELKLEVVEGIESVSLEPEKPVIGYVGERKKVLIVDDNITNLSMLVSLLEPLGFEIDTAENGEEAVKKAVAEKPDLILLDLLMPVMDGDEVLSRIKDDIELKAIKVIGVSAAVADKERTEAFAADSDDFISKPVNAALLLDKLKQQLEIEWIEKDAEESEKITGTDEAEPAKIPSRAVLDEIIYHAERGEFTKLSRILDELELEDAKYGGFSDGARKHARRYDDERIVEYIKSVSD